MNRKEFLKRELKDNPNEPLNYYMLALEYKKDNEVLTSKSYFTNLLLNFESYIPTYYTYASYLVELGEELFAEKILKKGLEVAKAANHQKATLEIQGLIDLYF